MGLRLGGGAHLTVENMHFCVCCNHVAYSWTTSPRSSRMRNSMLGEAPSGFLPVFSR